jgi:hypothetical protein
MKISIYRPALWLAVVAAIACTASAQSKPNQTFGYGEGKLLTFTYTQNFDCIDQPGSDLNFNGGGYPRDSGSPYRLRSRAIQSRPAIQDFVVT